MIETLLWKLILLINNILLRLFGRFSFSDVFRRVAYKGMVFKLAKKNVQLGVNSIVYNTKFSFSSKGDHFYIGDNTTITGATLLGHDASPCVFLDSLILKRNVWQAGSRRSYRDPICIGDNVFIGVGVIILPGVKIGDNVVVAAGSVVTANLQTGFVYGGNPAKKIKSIEDYKDKYIKIFNNFPERF